MSDCPELDGDTLSLLDLLDNDPQPSRQHDRHLIDRAVERVAMANDGIVSNNALRRELTGEWGLVVAPHTIGPRLAALTRQGVLEVVGWDVNDDASGNAGKMQKLRRYVGEAA